MRDNRHILICSAREYAYEEYLTALFSPVAARQDLLTLAAYTGELNRIPYQVRDHILAEIRFQWWREVFEKGENTGHPVADAMLDLRVRKGLPFDLLFSDLEIRALELDPQILSCATTRKDYFKFSERAYVQMRAYLLGYKVAGGIETLVSETTEILGILRYCRRLPLLRARHQDSKQDFSMGLQPENRRQTNENAHLCENDSGDLIHTLMTASARLRTELRTLEWGPHLIFLPLALVRPYLKVHTAVRAEGMSSGSRLRHPLPISLFLALFFSAKFKVF